MRKTMDFIFEKMGNALTALGGLGASLMTGDVNWLSIGSLFIAGIGAYGTFKQTMQRSSSDALQAKADAEFKFQEARIKASEAKRVEADTDAYIKQLNQGNEDNDND